MSPCPRFFRATANDCYDAPGYSGVSWAIFDQADWKVELITTWPRSGLAGDTQTSPKVPSLVSYAPDGRPGLVSWGFAAKDPFVDWFKLQLDPSHEHARKRNTIHGNASACREAERTTVDYLQALWMHAEETIRAHMPPGEGPSQHIFRVVLTVPAMWELSAKEKTKSLALRARIPGPIMMINEPEAAAIAGFRQLAENKYSFEVQQPVSLGHIASLNNPNTPSSDRGHFRCLRCGWRNRGKSLANYLGYRHVPTCMKHSLTTDCRISSPTPWRTLILSSSKNVAAEQVPSPCAPFLSPYNVWREARQSANVQSSCQEVFAAPLSSMWPSRM